AIDFGSLEGKFVDPLEHWKNDYTEDDTGVLTVNAAGDEIAIINMTRTSDSWVWKDHGAAHFATTGIDHDIEGELTDCDGANPRIHIYAMANTATPTNPIIQSNQRGDNACASWDNVFRPRMARTTVVTRPAIPTNKNTQFISSSPFLILFHVET
ncbi:hypothetical protein LCGC14_1845090, partial [marine sediment metagenome]